MSSSLCFILCKYQLSSVLCKRSRSRCDMAMDLSALVCCFFVLLLAHGCSATDHIVGANRGWQPPANAGESAHLNYTVWAASQKFYVEDLVSFHYPEGMQYSVFQVNYSVYTNCTINMWSGHDWIKNWTSKNGRSIVPLDKVMVYYFVDANNCNNGMKVAVNVTKNNTSLSAKSQKSEKSMAAPVPSQLSVLPIVFFAQAILFISVCLLFPAL